MNELEQKYAKLVPECVKVRSIDHVNHDPHPFMIGPRHITHASDNYGGILGEETMKAIPCAHPKCGLSHEKHTSDFVMFLSLTKDTDNNELSAGLQPLGDMMEEDEIDGICFMENAFKIIK